MEAAQLGQHSKNDYEDVRHHTIVENNKTLHDIFGPRWYMTSISSP
jgi:hypothetical protein